MLLTLTYPAATATMTKKYIFILIVIKIFLKSCVSPDFTLSHPWAKPPPQSAAVHLFRSASQACNPSNLAVLLPILKFSFAHINSPHSKFFAQFSYNSHVTLQCRSSPRVLSHTPSALLHSVCSTVHPDPLSPAVLFIFYLTTVLYTFINHN